MATLVQKAAPDFKLLACMPDNSFEEIQLSSFRGKWVVLYTYPCDFDFQCAAQLSSFAEHQAVFDREGVQLLGLSCDTHLAHRAMKALPEQDLGTPSVSFPLLSDVKKEACSALGVLQDNGLPLHGTFIIDCDGIVLCEMKLAKNPHIWGPIQVLQAWSGLMFSEVRHFEAALGKPSKSLSSEESCSHQDSDPKISDLIRKAKSGWFSFEFFPPKSEDGMRSLHRRIDRMKKLGPLFVDFTWGPGGTTSELTCSLAESARSDHGCVANLHLCCTNQKAEVTRSALTRMKAAGVRNMVALRGDPPARSGKASNEAEADDQLFSCSLDLIKYTRQHFADFFCIGVTGYPEGHPDNLETVQKVDELSASERRRAHTLKVDSRCRVCTDASFKKELAYLCDKCDAGGEFIITSFCCDVEVYCDFVKSCRECGIRVPIIPGIMCITKFADFQKLCSQGQCRPPEGMMEAAENAAKISDDAFKAWMLDMLVALCQGLLERGAPGLHFYTLNLEKVAIAVLLKLRLISAEQAIACQQSEPDTRQTTPSPTKK